jgi:predicted  nucleic acid-binding Zn-ribbon protein
VTTSKAVCAVCGHSYGDHAEVPHRWCAKWACGCKGYEYRTFSQELAELERTDPVVRAAAESFDRAARQVIEGRVHRLPCERPGCYWHDPTANARSED